LQHATAFWYPVSQMIPAGCRDHALLAIVVVPVGVSYAVAP
jgi:hypothetical protein